MAGFAGTFSLGATKGSTDTFSFSVTEGRFLNLFLYNDITFMDKEIQERANGIVEQYSSSILTSAQDFLKKLGIQKSIRLDVEEDYPAPSAKRSKISRFGDWKFDRDRAVKSAADDVCILKRKIREYLINLFKEFRVIRPFRFTFRGVIFTANLVGVYGYCFDRKVSIHCESKEEAIKKAETLKELLESDTNAVLV